jgi:hydroxyacylglutathione hydrolase
MALRPDSTLFILLSEALAKIPCYRLNTGKMTNDAMQLDVRPLRAFADNYIWLIDPPAAPGNVVVVDPGDATPVLDELRRTGTSLAAILLTHHHPDHIGGVADLLAQANSSTVQGKVEVIGPDDARIPLRTRTVSDGERFELPKLGLAFETLHVPGHTLTHVAFTGHGALFSGDTLFSAGCGRMFEGSPTQMSASLNRLAHLPPETQMYCGHEYTQANLAFALTVEPSNADTLRYRDAVAALRAVDAPTLPSPLGLEIRVNPFLRCDRAAVREAAEAHQGGTLGDTAAVFAVLRGWKDRFR